MAVHGPVGQIKDSFAVAFVHLRRNSAHIQRNICIPFLESVKGGGDGGRADWAEDSMGVAPAIRRYSARRQGDATLLDLNTMMAVGGGEQGQRTVAAV